MHRKIKEFRISLIFLTENKVCSNNLDTIFDRCTAGWSYFHNAQFSGISGIIVCWNPSNVAVTNVDNHSQVITCLWSLKMD